MAKKSIEDKEDLKEDLLIGSQPSVSVKADTENNPKIHLSKFLQNKDYSRGQIAILKARYNKEMLSISEWENISQTEFNRRMT